MWKIEIRYKDEWGEIWEVIDRFRVKRVKDGMVGGFYDGQGLNRLL